MNYLSFLKFFVSISLCFMLFSCLQTDKTFSEPKIKAGIAKVSGKVIGFTPKENQSFPNIVIRTEHPVVGENIEIIGQLNQDGSFEVEVPVECQILADLHIGDFYGVIGLTPDEETYIEITLNNSETPDIVITDKLGLTGNDVVNFIPAFMEMNDYRAGLPALDYRLPSNSFAQSYIKRVEESLALIENNSILSEKAKKLAIAKYKIERLHTVLMDYKEVVSILYQNDMIRQGKDISNDFVPEDPEKSYYSFLQYLDLNNPDNLQTFSYMYILEAILDNEILQIPPVLETPVETWLSGVKVTMSELVGFDEGLFYDLLASNSYAQQFNNGQKPLSDKQIENIKKYFKGEKGEIAKILLKKNEETVKWTAQKEPLVINETPVAPKEQLMDAIISKYQGKVVVVDFWATWCGPCWDAMKKHKTVKGKLQGKNVVFVYLTNGSSPQKLWEEKIKGIGGEHYYLNNKEWEHLMNSFDFEGIPSYLIFNIKGEFQHKFTGYPGNEEMQKMIEELF